MNRGKGMNKEPLDNITLWDGIGGKKNKKK
jgi:hypothetical protein